MFAVAVLLALPFVATSVLAQSASCTRTYTVKAGDFCDSISAMNNVSTYQLAAVNPTIDADCGNLLPGQSLCLGTAGQDCATTYVVQANDECDAISAANSINSTILLLNNPQIEEDCSNIYSGEVLCVAGSVLVPAGTTSSTVTVPAVNVVAAPTVAASTSAVPSVSLSTSTPAAVTPAATPITGEDESELPFCEDDEEEEDED